MRKGLMLWAILFIVFSQGIAWAENSISAHDAYMNANRKEMLIIDIRHPSEWRETGIGANAVALTMHQQGGPAAFLNAVENLINGDRTTPIALICASGVRSSWAQHFLTAQGLSNVRHIPEGMLGRGPKAGWIDQNLPMRPYQQ